jgi:hypothetical protein
VRVSCRLNAPETVGVVLGLDWLPSLHSDDAASSPSGANTIAIEGAKEEHQYSSPVGRALGDPALLDTLSYTALSELGRCGYRYYLERVLGLAERHSPAGAEESRNDDDRNGLEARLRGTIIHRLLETLDFAQGGVPSEADVAILAHEEGVHIGPRELEEIATLLSTAFQTEFGARLAAAARRVRREYPFAFSLGPNEPLLTGVIDLLVREPDGGVLVVDYKSDRVGAEEDLGAVVGRDYEIQRLIYALAALSDGAPRVEIVHWFLHRPEEPICVGYTAADKPELEDRVAELARRARTHTFAVSKEPHRGLCLTCPGRSGLCSWDDSDTLREHVGA